MVHASFVPSEMVGTGGGGVAAAVRGGAWTGVSGAPRRSYSGDCSTVFIVMFVTLTLSNDVVFVVSECTVVSTLPGEGAPAVRSGCACAGGRKAFRTRMDSVTRLISDGAWGCASKKNSFVAFTLGTVALHIGSVCWRIVGGLQGLSGSFRSGAETCWLCVTRINAAALLLGGLVSSWEEDDAACPGTAALFGTVGSGYMG